MLRWVLVRVLLRGPWGGQLWKGGAQAAVAARGINVAAQVESPPSPSRVDVMRRRRRVDCLPWLSHQDDERLHRCFPIYRCVHFRDLQQTNKRMRRGGSWDVEGHQTRSTTNTRGAMNVGKKGKARQWRGVAMRHQRPRVTSHANPCQPRANSICTLCAMRRGDAQPWGATARWHGASGGRHAYAPVVWQNHCVGMALRSAEVVREVVRRLPGPCAQREIRGQQCAKCKRCE